MQATDPITVIIRLQKFIKVSIEDNAQVLISGGVDTMEKYNYITGKIHGLDQIQQEISTLLEPKEPDNDDDKVTRIRR
tara:strand:- start:3538 stop:3771 length:234 start_codon:yes stop_codon:yes gene_type:complete